MRYIRSARKTPSAIAWSLIAVRRGDQTNVDLDLFHAADAEERTRFETHAAVSTEAASASPLSRRGKEFRRRRFQKGRACASWHPRTLRPRGRTVRFKQSVLQRRAVQIDEWFVASAAQTVDRLGDQFLSDARFAGDHNGGIRRGDALDETQSLLHLRRLGDDLGQAVDAMRAIWARRRWLSTFSCCFSAAAVDESGKLADAVRLGQVVVGAELHRLDRGFDRRLAGEHDHLGRVLASLASASAAGPCRRAAAC